MVLRLADPDCSILQRLRLPILPSHLYADDFSDLATNSQSVDPQITSGPYRFLDRQPGERIVLERNPYYWNETPRYDQWEFRIEPDIHDQSEILTANEADIVRIEARKYAQYTDMGFDNYRVEAFPSSDITFLALNVADPQNPQAGQDEAGVVLEQSPHPVLGDSVVRRAIAQGIDYERLLTDAFDGHGFTPVSVVTSSVPWAFADDIKPYGYQPVGARASLEAAGWHDADGDGVREKEDVRLALTLLTNQENAQRMHAADFIATQLGDLGMEITLESMSFEQVGEAVLGQQYDMALLAWNNLPADPGLMPLWRSADDLPGAGVNFTSYHDAEVDAWLKDAQRLPGCGLEERGDLYKRIQRRVHDDAPYVLLHGDEVGWIVNDSLALEPGPWGLGGIVR